MKLVCFTCHFANDIIDRVGFRDHCQKCYSDLHSCRNCEFFDSAAYNECREPAAEFVKDKEKANFCDFFQPTQSLEHKVKIPSKQVLRAQAEALFKSNTDIQEAPKDYSNKQSRE